MSLLPYNASASQRAVESATAARLDALPAQIPRTVTNPALCPAPLLPWLAWATAVENWSPLWDEAQQRAAIAASRQVHRIKGTPAAVRAAIAPFGVAAQVFEAHQQQPPAPKNTFALRVQITQAGLDAQRWATLLESVNTAKRLSSHLTSVRVVLLTTATKRMAVVGIAHRVITSRAHVLPPTTPGELLTLNGSWQLDGSQTLDAIAG